MKLLVLFVMGLAVVSGGCSISKVYNPVTASLQQTFLLNESALAQVTTGMNQAQVHQIMGESIVIGYAYQKAVSDKDSALNASSADYKPLTIANPYKTEQIKTLEGVYLIEYYVSSIRQSDGTITDDELIPLIFREGMLMAKGWDYLKSLRLKNPA